MVLVGIGLALLVAAAAAIAYDDDDDDDNNKRSLLMPQLDGLLQNRQVAQMAEMALRSIARRW